MTANSSSVTRDGMRIDWGVPIAMDDGLELRCDVFRPTMDGRYPAIVAMGPYGKWLHFAEFPGQYNRLIQEHPEVLSDTSGNYLNYETVDPEKFVTDGYVVVRVDSRGAGRSPGFMDIWSLREAQDHYSCIEWAAVQPWCTGKVGLSGISYLAMNQWQVAALQPPHLTCMFVFEGAYDYYRDMARHGGILCTFSKILYGPAILSVQHGRGRRGQRSRMNGDWVSGPATLTDEELGNNRREWHEGMRIAIVLLLSILIGADRAAADTMVNDGDTLTLDGIRYRLEGVDAPDEGDATIFVGVVAPGMTGAALDENVAGHEQHLAPRPSAPRSRPSAATFVRPHGWRKRGPRPPRSSRPGSLLGLVLRQRL
ncbi:MAG: CocE/NonD family hydrolase [Hyphomicrobiales bacterium]|nr:CocE/NonD family hydrolase [Hyphomicrobiales bacterium]